MQRKVIFAGDSLLREIKDPVCGPHSSSKEVYCCSGALVRDIARKLLGLVHSSDHYPYLIAQAGSGEAAEGRLGAIKRGFRSLGQLADGVRVRMGLSSVVSVVWRDSKRTRKSHLMNT